MADHGDKFERHHASKRFEAFSFSLSLSIDCVNHGANAVFRKYLDGEVWENVDKLDMSINEGMTTIAKDLYMGMMRKGSCIKTQMIDIIITLFN